MRRRLDEAGVTAPAVVIKSNGGEMTLEAAAERAGQHGGLGPDRRRDRQPARRRADRHRHLVTLDMGGTSTDVSTVIGGKESFTTAFEIEWGVPIQIPMIDIRTIGAGGGSIAWIDKGGMLRVGPQSAGADAGAGLLRRGRDRGDGDRRQPRARPDRPRQLPRRRGCGSTSRRPRRGGRRAWPRRSGRSVEDAAHGDRAHRQQQHDRRAALGADRARARPARLHALRLRRRRAAARERADRETWASRARSCRTIPASSRPTASS